MTLAAKTKLRFMDGELCPNVPFVKLPFKISGEKYGETNIDIIVKIKRGENWN